MQHPVAHGNAGVLLLLEGFGRVLAHVDDLGGGHQTQAARRRPPCCCEQGAHGVFLPDEHDLSLAGQLFGGQHGTLDGGLGGEIAAHCVQGYLHERKVKRIRVILAVS